jgi:hypothetical protein
MTENSKKFKAKRYFSARGDASVGSLQGTIEKQFGLPDGSVRLLRPSGRAKRSDASVSSLRRDWEG